MTFAIRTLCYDRLRLFLSVTGVALALMLAALLNGLLSGMYTQVSAYLDHAPGSLVVAQSGVTNLLGATSLLPPGSAMSVSQIDGVSKVTPILSQFVVAELHGNKQAVYLIGYDPALGGGPWRLASGREPQSEGEIVFDSVLAGRHNVSVGDDIELLGQPLTVSGLSAGTTSWMTSFVFVRKETAESLLRAPGVSSFLLVAPEPGVSDEELAGRLRAMPGIEVLPTRAMMTNDVKLLSRFFSAPLRLMVGIALLIGALVVGVVISTATAERHRDYGVLKAIGIRNRHLCYLVVSQALVTAGIGTVVGLGLALVAGRLIETIRPQFLVAIEPEAVVWMIAGGLGVALLAALTPALQVVRLAPSDVFRRAA